MIALTAAVKSKLTSGTALTVLVGGTVPRIYHLQAPENATKPYVVYSTQSDVEENDTAHRVKSSLVFARAYSSVSAVEAGSIDGQIDALLHDGTLGISGWSNVAPYVKREQSLETVENPESGSPIFMQGGLYRVVFEEN